MDWDSARSFYEKAALIDKHQIDVSFRLSMLALMDQDLERCIRYCDQLFKELNITHSMVIGNAADFAQVYKLMGEAFLAASGTLKVDFMICFNDLMFFDNLKGGGV